MLEVVKRHEGVLRGEHTDIDWDDYCMIVLKPFTALCLRALINSEKLHQNEEFSCIFANLLKLRETTGTTTCAIFFNPSKKVNCTKVTHEAEMPSSMHARQPVWVMCNLSVFRCFPVQ